MVAQVAFVTGVCLVVGSYAADPATLAADDTCAAGDNACALNALQSQMSEAKVELHSQKTTVTCEKQTGGSCAAMSCDSSRNAECSSTGMFSGDCVCRAGECNVNGACVTPYFEQVGPNNRACRGHDGANLDSYYSILWNIGDLKTCQDKCLEAGDCTGVEFQTSESTVQEGRCELWKDTIGGTASVKGYNCYQLTLPGASLLQERNSDATVKLHANRTSTAASGCNRDTGGSCAAMSCDSSRDAICESTGMFSGQCVCHKDACSTSSGKCVSPTWEQIGPDNRACRGPDGSNLDSYYTIKWNVATRGECESYCLAAGNCVGIEWQTSSASVQEGRCELWTQQIEGTAHATGYQCLKFTVA